MTWPSGKSGTVPVRTWYLYESKTSGAFFGISWQSIARRPIAQSGTTATNIGAEEDRTMLGDYEVMSFVGTTDPERAKAFYGGVLGLKLVEDAWWAIIYEVGGRHLHVEKAREKFTPVPFTAAGWKVPDIGGRSWRSSPKRASSSSAFRNCNKTARESGPLRTDWPRCVGSKIQMAICCR